MSEDSKNGVRRITTRNIRQKAIINADDSQKRIKIDAPETARVAITKLVFALLIELSSINLR